MVRQKEDDAKGPKPQYITNAQFASVNCGMGLGGEYAVFNASVPLWK